MTPTEKQAEQLRLLYENGLLEKEAYQIAIEKLNARQNKGKSAGDRLVLFPAQQVEADADLLTRTGIPSLPLQLGQGENSTPCRCQ